MSRNITIESAKERMTCYFCQNLIYKNERYVKTDYLSLGLRNWCLHCLYCRYKAGIIRGYYSEFFENANLKLLLTEVALTEGKIR